MAGMHSLQQLQRSDVWQREEMKLYTQISDRKTMKVFGTRIKGWFAWLMCMACLFGLTGCQSTKLAEGFDQQTIKNSAEELINKVQMDGAKQALTECMREDFAQNMDMDTMENTVLNLTKGKGDFVAYTAESVIGKYHKEAKEDFGVAVITASYEKGEIIYTITFDIDMKVVGFYAQ